MERKVAVEDNLTNIKNVLQQKGYTVVNPKSRDEVLASVVMGMDKNLMDIQTAANRAPVIDASGLTAEQVVAKIEQLG